MAADLKSSGTKAKRLKRQALFKADRAEADRELVKAAVARLTCECYKYPGASAEDAAHDLCWHCSVCDRAINWYQDSGHYQQIHRDPLIVAYRRQFDGS